MRVLIALECPDKSHAPQITLGRWQPRRLGHLPTRYGSCANLNVHILFTLFSQLNSLLNSPLLEYEYSRTSVLELI